MEPTPTRIQYAGDDFFIAITPSGHAQTVDVRGERRAAAGPLELFLTGLGCCTAADVISVLHKKREPVTEYRIEIRTERRDEHPRSFKKISLKHIVRGNGISPQAVAHAIELSTTKYCSALATVQPTAEIVTSYEIEPERASKDPVEVK